MNFFLPYIPDRTIKPRENGITMVMDKGLSVKEAENLVEVASQYIDFVKLGFGTSYFTPNLKDKIKIYKEAGLKPYLGGTLFEAFIIRGYFKEYLKLLKDLDLETVEISDGSMIMTIEQKTGYIKDLSKDYLVLSEVGSKQKGVVLSTEEWIEKIKSELNAGSWKVIAEARESGTVGIYHENGTAKEELISCITKNVDITKIIWEAPSSKQQSYFIKHYGANVNLGNIAVNDIIPLECLRCGLRGDTFFEFLPEDLKKFQQK